jgi:hypothetical protein
MFDLVSTTRAETNPPTCRAFVKKRLQYAGICADMQRFGNFGAEVPKQSCRFDSLCLARRHRRALLELGLSADQLVCEVLNEGHQIRKVRRLAAEIRTKSFRRCAKDAELPSHSQLRARCHGSGLSCGPARRRRRCRRPARKSSHTTAIVGDGRRSLAFIAPQARPLGRLPRVLPSKE